MPRRNACYPTDGGDTNEHGALASAAAAALPARPSARAPAANLTTTLTAAILAAAILATALAAAAHATAAVACHLFGGIWGSDALACQLRQSEDCAVEGLARV